MTRARIAIIAAAAFIAVTGAACSISHRSGDFACTKQSDCNGGRVCEDGFCIDPNAADGPTNHVDAPSTRPDAADQCPPQCTSCNNEAHTCTINCMQTSCDGLVTCPAGYACDIRCNTGNACNSGVDCTAGKSCAITCSGDGACRDVQCGAGRCNLTCSGFQSCRTVDCGNSCACDVTCTGPQSCFDGIFCTSFSCDTGLGCSSLPPGCNTCP